MTPFVDRVRGEGVVSVDGFLAPEPRQRVLDELEFAFWWPSTVVNRGPDGRLVTGMSGSRRSATTDQSWFTDDLQVEVRRIERRLSRMLRIDGSRLEDWQATRYGYRDQFRPHLDGGLFSGEAAGERVFTILVCLRAPAEGGGTKFPRRKLVVAAEAGRLVVWRNLRDDGTVDQSMLHASAPVRRGGKVILVTWCRERPVRRPRSNTSTTRGPTT